MLICFPFAFHAQLYVCGIICLAIHVLLGFQLTHMHMMSLHLHSVHVPHSVCSWRRYLFSCTHTAVLFQCLHLMLCVVCISPCNLPCSPWAVGASPAASRVGCFLQNHRITSSAIRLSFDRPRSDQPLRPSTQTTDTYLAPVTSLYALCLHGPLPLPVPCWGFPEAPTHILRIPYSVDIGIPTVSLLPWT